MKSIVCQSTKQYTKQSINKPILQGQRAINYLVQQNILLKKQLSQIFNFNPHLKNQFNFQKPILIQQNSNINIIPSDNRFSVRISNNDEKETSLIQNSYRQKIIKLKAKKNSSHERRLSQCKSAKVVFQTTNIDKISNGQVYSNNNSRCKIAFELSQKSQTNSLLKIHQQNKANSFVKQNNLYKELQGKVNNLSKCNNFQQEMHKNRICQQKNTNIILVKQNNQNRILIKQNKEQNQSSFKVKENNEKTLRNTFSLSKKMKSQEQNLKTKFVPKDPAIFNLKKLNQDNYQKINKHRTQLPIDINKINQQLCQQNKLQLQKQNNKKNNQKGTYCIQIKQLRGNIYLEDQQSVLHQKNHKLDKQVKGYQQKYIITQNFDKNNHKLNEAKTFRKRQKNLNLQNVINNDSQVVSLQYFMKSEEKNNKNSTNSYKPKQQKMKNRLLNNVYIEEE